MPDKVFRLAGTFLAWESYAKKLFQKLDFCQRDEYKTKSIFNEYFTSIKDLNFMYKKADISGKQEALIFTSIW